MNSGFLELFSGFQSPRFRNPKAKISWISDPTSKHFSDYGIHIPFHGARRDNNPTANVNMNYVDFLTVKERYNRDIISRPTFNDTILIAEKQWTACHQRMWTGFCKSRNRPGTPPNTSGTHRNTPGTNTPATPQNIPGTPSGHREIPRHTPLTERFFLKHP